MSKELQQLRDTLEVALETISAGNAQGAVQHLASAADRIVRLFDHIERTQSDLDARLRNLEGKT
jgi:hypothetical protein